MPHTASAIKRNAANFAHPKGNFRSSEEPFLLYLCLLLRVERCHAINFRDAKSLSIIDLYSACTNRPAFFCLYLQSGTSIAAINLS